jgi:elongation of very long chain fatty acids protein 6
MAAPDNLTIWDVPYWDGFEHWMARHYDLAFGICAAYLVIIFTIQWLMSDPKTKGFELKFPLIVWNAGLAIFSIFGAYHVLPAIYEVVREKGLSYDLCSPDSEKKTVWVFFFCASKVPELCDTLFLVLRKRPLRFLHYYHHVVTLLFCWDAWAQGAEHGGWFAGMNLFVHSIMYSYYCLSACGVRFSNLLRQSITSLQILQMFGGVAIVIHNWRVCNYHPSNTLFGLLMYFSYMVLFAKLFYESYVSPPKKYSADKKPIARKVAKAD